ncbi:MAG: hypothetical protein OXT71_17360 [Acidobacteriota bacterium]|nr:hypothetical protein [Acidobacteriota bacterium]
MTNRTKAVFWIIFVFLSGSFVGGVLTHVLIRPAQYHAGGGPDRRPPAREPGQPRRNGSRFFQHLDRVLDLDSEQEVQVRRILETTRKSFREAAEEAAKMHREIRSQAGNQIRVLLRPEQAEKFDEMTRRMERKFREGKRRRLGPVK